MCPCYVRLFVASSSTLLNTTATADTYTLSLHDALPISPSPTKKFATVTLSVVPTMDSTRLFEPAGRVMRTSLGATPSFRLMGSEVHTSLLQSLTEFVCCPLPER